MWWMHNRVNRDQLPEQRVAVQFDFYGAQTCTYWLLLTRQEVAICLTDPGYEIEVLVTADLATFFGVWLGRIDYHEALRAERVRVEGTPRLVRAFPDWFAWSPAASMVRAVRAKQSALADPILGA